MSTESKQCFYHYESSAISSCFRCNRPICSKDTSSFEDYNGDYMMVREYCTPCFFIRTSLESGSNIPIILSYIFLVIWSILVLWIFFPLIIFSFFIYKFINNNRKNRNKKLKISRQEFENFLLTIPEEKLMKQSTSCLNCGNTINTEDKFCANCCFDTEFLENKDHSTLPKINIICFRCQNIIIPSDRFCSICVDEDSVDEQ